MSDSSVSVLERVDEKIEEPKMYHVILHNDNYTTMEFVVQILVQIFDKSVSEAASLMIKIHQEGKGIAGTYIEDIAKTKQYLAQKSAEMNEFPLKITIKPVS